MNKLHYSGHDTFVVRTFWPKKGYDFITHNGDFNADNSVVELGVGKNMVSSIKFWMKALNLINEDDNRQTQLADFLFAENGADPYLEDTASIWIIIWFLISLEKRGQLLPKNSYIHTLKDNSKSRTITDTIPIQLIKI
jgi:hypothetical protein